MECKCNHQLVTKLTLIGDKRTISDYCPLCKQESNTKDLNAQHQPETTRHAPQTHNHVTNDPQLPNHQEGAFPVD